MRTTLLALALALVACGRSDRASPSSSANASSTSAHGPDQLVLRVPRTGGVAHAYAYPAVDSVVWTSAGAVPALDRVLAFDEDAGTIAAVDNKGAPVRIDLRRGAATRDAKPALTGLTSVDGSAIYGLATDGTVTRLTPGGRWTFKPPHPAREIYPQPNGELLLLVEEGDSAAVLAMHPPETKIIDSAAVPRPTRALRTPVGDRVYFTVDSGLIGLRGRDLTPVKSVRLQHSVRALVTTPSGDRLYVAPDSLHQVVVVDRYSEAIVSRIDVPGQVVDLRMDPTGRYLLAQPAAGDSAWVIGVGEDKIAGTVETAWRPDLPAVAPDGAVAVVRGRDVVLLDGATQKVQRRVADGARDFWYFFFWNGFRQHPAVADAIPIDSAPAPPPDTTNPFAGAAIPTDTSARTKTDTTSATRDSAAGAAAVRGTSAVAAPAFTLQFAALRDESGANDLARTIRTGSTNARLVATTRVVSSTVGGTVVYRVVAGPFRTKEDAEHAGQESGKPYWVYEGMP